MMLQTKPGASAINDFKVRLEQLERQADALRSGLDDVALLFAWTMERAIPFDAFQRVIIADEQIAAHRQWNGQTVSVELARLFLQAHTIATRLKHAAPREDKDAVVAAVVKTFRHMAAERHFQAPIEMEVTIGD